MVTVEQMIKDGRSIADPNVGSWFSRMSTLQAALVSITKRSKSDHREWSRWWAAAEKDFKVEE